MSIEKIAIALAIAAFVYFVYKAGRIMGRDAARKSQVFQPPSDYWQELATLIVWKCARNGVSITAKDMARYEKEFTKVGAILITGGEPERLTFKVVSKDKARETYEYNEQDN